MDKDLEFLRNCDNDDLLTLTDYITKNKKGDIRLTETLTVTEEYKANYPNNIVNFIDKIEEEFRLFGGNSIANILRGSGPSYREILIDVAKKIKVNFNPNSPVDIIETNLLQKVLEKKLENMSEEELIKMREELGEKTDNKDLNKQAIISSILLIMKRGGFGSYKMAVIIANSFSKAILGRGLSFAGNRILVKGLKIFTGPIGWGILTAWTIFDIASPAYRVTMPCVIQIAYMRAKQEYLNTQSGL